MENLPEEEKKLEKISDEKQKESAEAAKQSYRSFLTNILEYFRELLNLNLGADKVATIERIKGDIDFKGATVWILIASIFVASIGLNVNSTAVVIGAMLISPLMGPILGIGLSVGINDWGTLKRSLRNFGIATLVSIVTATVFFTITPFKEGSSELLGRTSPHFYDALIAFFGGIAGIIGVSRKEKTNVIPGVAIATALMPPLCTAGFGLATGEWRYFLGAFYLYFLNAFFIALATFLIVRLLRIPITTFIDPKKEKKFKRYIAISTLLIVLPSGYLFYQVMQESIMESAANQFVVEEIEYEGAGIASTTFNYEREGQSILDVVLFGNPVPRGVIKKWKKDLAKEYPEAELKLNIIQSKDISADINEFKGKLESVKADLYKDLQEETLAKLKAKEKEIETLKEKLAKYESEEVPFSNISKELQVIEPQVVSIAYGKMINDSDFETKILTFVVNTSIEEVETIPSIKEKIEKWLKARVGSDHIQVILHNSI